jgi:hypothetical protein
MVIQTPDFKDETKASMYNQNNKVDVSILLFQTKTMMTFSRIQD